MRIFFTALLALSLSSTTLWCQLSFKLHKTIAIKKGVTSLTADQFANLYLTYNEELKKLDPQGKELYSYSYPLYGDITTVDALNALNPLLFYNDVNQLRLVDNRLNESQAYDLLSAGFLDPTLVAYTDEDNIWIYDQVQDRIVRYNLRHAKTTAQTQVITQIINYENKPAGLFSSFNYLILELPGQSLMVFDALGAYKKSLELPENQMVGFYNQSIITLSQQGGVSLFNLRENKKWLGLLPEQGMQQIYFEGNKIYLLFEKEIKVYELIIEA